MSKKYKVDLKCAMLCDKCGKSFRLKASLVKHLQIHMAREKLPNTDGLICNQCNIVFKNKGLMMCHLVNVHIRKTHTPRTSCVSQQPASPKPQETVNKYKHICEACQTNFFYLKDLRFHIRDAHFNLLSHLPYYEFKKVNQVWFEKVLNSKNIVEIKKVAQNILLMRKLNDNTAMKVSDHITEVIDLQTLYPTKREKNILCNFCLKMYDKAYINKHISDVHKKYNDPQLI